MSSRCCLGELCEVVDDHKEAGIVRVGLTNLPDVKLDHIVRMTAFYALQRVAGVSSRMLHFSGGNGTLDVVYYI